ncbi:MAG: 2OG-Fe(II) oxygenase [Chloroflexota bacterium]
MENKSALERDGYQVIDDFISHDECKKILGLVNKYREQNEIPEIHRPVKGRSLRYFVINGEMIENDLPDIWGLYQNKVHQQINDLTQDDFALLENKLVGVNVNIMPPEKSSYRWHYDRTTITSILYLNQVKSGETVLYPHYRILLKNNKFAKLQQLMDKIITLKPIRTLFKKKVVVAPVPGRLAIMEGKTCWHSVRSLEGDKDRINIIMSFDYPGIQFPMEEGLDKYLYTREKQKSADPNYAK